MLDDNEILEQEMNLTELRHAHALLANNFPQALTELEDLANRGSVMAMLYLAHTHKQRGKDGYAMAEEWYERAYQRNSASALLHLALMKYQDGNIKKAKQLWMDGVSRNDGPSMFWLASLYIQNPNFGKRDQIRILLERADKLGQLRAKHRLSVMFMMGQYGISNIPRGILMFLEFIVIGLRIAHQNPANRRLW